jgi:hypothetical protein
MLVSFLTFPQTAFAQDRLTDVGLLPDNPFYVFKLFTENLQEQFTFDRAQRAEILLEHAEVRRAEIEQLVLRNISIPEETVRIQDEKLTKAIEIISELEGNGVAIVALETVIERDQLEKISDVDSDQTKINKLRDRLQLAFSDRQVSDIKLKFNDVVTEEDAVKRRILAQQLDEEVNNPIVNLSCFGRINTLEIADSVDPVEKLQEQCLFLKPIPTEQLRRIMQNAG